MIKEDKTRVLVTIPKDMKKDLEDMAKKETRSLSNFILEIIKDYMKHYTK